MQAIDQANFAYAKEGCYRCGRNDHLVDMDVHVEGEGALAFCESCLVQAVEARGRKVLKARPAK